MLLIAAMLFTAAVIPAAASGYALGDVDRNGQLEPADARLALRASLKLDTVDEEQMVLADADANGKVDSADARLILRASLGLDTIHTHSYSTWQPKDKDGNATDYHYQVCSGCDSVIKEEHSFELVMIQQVDCLHTGYGKYQCTVCGLSKDPFQTTGAHNWETVSVTPETCTDDGKIVKQCSLCSQQEIEKLPAKHIPGAAATCLEPQKCERCSEVLAEALGHQLPAKVSIGVTTGVNCTRCGEEAIPSFNTLVNSLKTGSHKYTSIDKNVTTFNEPTFSGLMIAMKALFSEDFKDSIGTTEEYSAPIQNRQLNTYTFHLNGEKVVSRLKDSNVSSIKTERINKLDFASSLPSSYKVYTYNYDGSVKSSTDYDISRLKTNVSGDFFKVTVTLKEEIYSQYRNLGGTDGIGNIYSDFGEMLSSVLDAFEDEDFGGIFVPKGDAVSNATVVYYFDAETLAPAAAVYTISMDVDEEMNLYLTDDGELTSKPTGSLKMDVDNKMTSYYFFDSFC